MLGNLLLRYAEPCGARILSAKKAWSGVQTTFIALFLLTLTVIFLKYTAWISLYELHLTPTSPRSRHVGTDAGSLVTYMSGGRIGQLLGRSAGKNDSLPLCPKRPRNLGG